LTFTADLSGYDSYQWIETGSGTVSITTTNTKTETFAGTYCYIVRVQNANGCWSAFSDTVSGTVYALPATPVINPVTSVCDGATLTFTTNAVATEYEWVETVSGSAPTTTTLGEISQTDPGVYVYKVRVKDTNGCWSEYSAEVSGEVYSSFAAPVIEPSGTVAICEGDSLTLSAETGFANYTWYNNGILLSSGSTNTIRVSAGNYTVAVVTAEGCTSDISDATTVEIVAYPAKPIITAAGLSADKVVWRQVGTGIVFEVSNKTDEVIYQWYHGGVALGQGEALSLAAVQITDAGKYSVVARTIKAQCETESDEVDLQIAAAVYVPKLVTPNGNDQNDNLYIKGLAMYPHNELIIVNRWGNEVFRTKDYVNGSWTGDNLPDDTYFYRLKLVDFNGRASETTGYFHLKK
jgi:gliding motility-associated-like protein